MKLSCSRVVLLVLLSSVIAAAQSQPVGDPYKPVLDRLQAITTIPLENWGQTAADVSHGEAPGPQIPAKAVLGVGSKFGLPVWLYSSVEVPKRLNGYGLDGAWLRLHLDVDSNHEINVSVFANGNMIARTDGEGQVPITLTKAAQPGQKYMFAVRVLATGGVGCCGGELSASLARAEILVEWPTDRPTGKTSHPDPGVFRQEVMAAELLIAAYPDGKAERQQQLDAAVKAVDLGALDHGDQATFDASLRAAQGKLDVLRPYMKQFTVKAVGNSR